jgi:hypothetical protein
MQEAVKHEPKSCPRCRAAFECKVGSILLCQCSAVKVNDEERAYFRQGGYTDCLCAACMEELKKEYHAGQFRRKLKKIVGMFYKADS